MSLSHNLFPKEPLRVMQLLFEHKIEGKLKKAIKIFSRNYFYRLGNSFEICEEITPPFDRVE
jgi:hypothetical protein